MIGAPKVPEPTPREIIALDDQLADRGVPVFERPFQAAKLWGEKFGSPLAALESEGFFRQRYRELHPSVPFGSESFLTLCVSARAVSYKIRPPMALGRVGIKPLDHTTISEFEVSRLWHDHREAFWELQWQGFDAVDLFMSLVNFHPKDQAARNMIDTAVNQMTASARQLVACEIDSSLPQGMALACELAGKSVFLHCGGDPEMLKKIGHNMPMLIDQIRKTRKLPSSPVQNDIDKIASEAPKYVEVRYSSPPMTMLDAQDLFRKSMFLIADLLRQTNHDQGYWRKLRDGDMPPRSFSRP